MKLCQEVGKISITLVLIVSLARLNFALQNFWRVKFLGFGFILAGRGFGPEV